MTAQETVLLEQEFRAGRITFDELMKRMRPAKSISLKVSEKGCVSVNGLRRFPVSMYMDEWETILGAKDEILQFIKDNKSSLSHK